MRKRGDYAMPILGWVTVRGETVEGEVIPFWGLVYAGSAPQANPEDV